MVGLQSSSNCVVIYGRWFTPMVGLQSSGWLWRLWCFLWLPSRWCGSCGASVVWIASPTFLSSTISSLVTRWLCVDWQCCLCFTVMTLTDTWSFTSTPLTTTTMMQLKHQVVVVNCCETDSDSKLSLMKSFCVCVPAVSHFVTHQTVSVSVILIYNQTNLLVWVACIARLHSAW